MTTNAFGKKYFNLQKSRKGTMISREERIKKKQKTIKKKKTTKKIKKPIKQGVCSCVLKKK